MRRVPSVLLPLILLGLTACPKVEEPPCPEIEIPEQTGECNTLCDCGCVGHVVARCLHDVEDCQVAVRLAAGFVDDALAAQEAGALPAGAPSTEDESLPGEHVNEEAGATPAGEESAPPADQPAANAAPESDAAPDASPSGDPD